MSFKSLGKLKVLVNAVYCTNPALLNRLIPKCHEPIGLPAVLLIISESLLQNIAARNCIKFYSHIYT